VFAVERETTAWDHAVDMRMMQKILAPGMKHTQEADLAPRCFASAATSSNVAALVRNNRS